MARTSSHDTTSRGPHGPHGLSRHHEPRPAWPARTPEGTGGRALHRVHWQLRNVGWTTEDNERIERDDPAGTLSVGRCQYFGTKL
jgi:hypothetical protein